MQIECSTEKLHALYIKARESLSTCVGFEENKFLQEELGVPWTSVMVKDSEVKISFYETKAETYVIEVCLQLYVSGELTGAYTYYEDEKGHPQDDSLVLY
ncbi:hypothetical protein [Chitinophaga varians]|uniref:hypothetical protein n=1 Tax=Chitinophaga varians TaxID=2202339 RepID=UPI00165F7213|nr:hypothetical protein [Chitinophaga varians]MBC9911417.1 hypothetical protein [Chitinophaga varians]